MRLAKLVALAIVPIGRAFVAASFVASCGPSNEHAPGAPGCPEPECVLGIGPGHGGGSELGGSGSTGGSTGDGGSNPGTPTGPGGPEAGTDAGGVPAVDARPPVPDATTPTTPGAADATTPVSPMP